MERLHAVVAWLSTAALVTSAWLVASPARARRATLIASAAALGLVVVAGGLGLALHDAYRARLRQRLFLDSPVLGWMFERKQHAAFAAILFGVSALAVVSGLKQPSREVVLMRDLRRSARLASITAAALALLASIASALVARRAHF